MDWSLSKVKSTLYRARMQLKQHLAEKGRTDRYDLLFSEGFTPFIY
ncbi:hypothetical protein ACTWKC_19240 [Bacillus sp. 4A_MP3]